MLVLSATPTTFVFQIATPKTRVFLSATITTVPIERGASHGGGSLTHKRTLTLGHGTSLPVLSGNKEIEEVHHVTFLFVLVVTTCVPEVLNQIQTLP